MSKDTQQRRVVGYLKPSNQTFFTKYASVNEISESKAVNEAVKALKACQPPEVLERILNSKNYY